MEELKKRHRYGLFTQNEIRGLKLPENSVYFDSAHDRKTFKIQEKMGPLDRLKTEYILEDNFQ